MSAKRKSNKFVSVENEREMSQERSNMTKTPAFLFKLVELMLSIVGLILLLEYDAYNADMELVTIIVAFPAIVGYLYIIATYIMIYIFDRTNSILEIMQMSVGGILNFWTGVQSMHDYLSSNKSMPEATLVLSVECVICGMVMLADAIREYKKFRREKFSEAK